MRRRRFVGGAALGAAALAGLTAPLIGSAVRRANGESPGRLLTSRARLPRPYETPLPIPRTLAPVGRGATDVYEITQQKAQLDILPGLRTEAWTYGGTFPGPTLVSRSGHRTQVRHRNTLPQPTVVHLHGGHTPADSDGYPLDVVLPADGSITGERALAAMTEGMPGHAGGHHGGAPGVSGMVHGERLHTYPMRQRAATLWYHDHRMSWTGHGVWRGLAGFHLVRDDEEEALPLPKGERELPLMITDRAFEEDGSFRYPLADPRLLTPGVDHAYMDGVLGDVVLVNGAPWPVHRTPRARHRLRLLNASNARPYRLRLEPQPSGGDAFVQIGGDGGLLARPVRHDELHIGTGERFDVVVDFARWKPGTLVRMVNTLAEGGAHEVMAFEIAGGTVRDDSAVPGTLSRVERLDPAKAVVTREFRFRQGGDGWTINDHGYLPGRALARPRLGQTEIWRFTTSLHHPVHVHLDHFQVLSRNNGAPGPYDAGWKDTVDLPPTESVEVAVRFTDYGGTYMLHCHNLEHEDMAMMADFVVE
ncbi:multicopper oxidase family protein [Streptomyces marokkonensis]|uniref:multicopper oxidase family protein n=1 Tax=Streptomyces marokkonensis TaxID=324855 RepID=UPI0011F0CFC2|nr:multicopper oxidase domain-containing protein [Streptomyces marokkonensis]